MLLPKINKCCHRQVIDADGDLNTPTYDFDSGNSFGHFGFDMNDP